MQIKTMLYSKTKEIKHKKGTKEIEEEVKAYIGTVNALDEYAKYYSYFRSIVGALTSTYIIQQNNEKDKKER